MKKITCVVCPRGCIMTVTGQGTEFSVSGNACPRGEAHAIAECTNPVRSLTSIVRVGNREDTMVSVKSASPVPKEKMFEIMEQIRSSEVQAPVSIGDVVLDHVFGTQIIVTKNID